MSVWYRVEGTVKINKACKFSIFTYLQDIMCVECRPSVKLEKEAADNYYYRVQWTNSQDGEAASHEILLFCQKVKSLNKNNELDLTSEIRFLI